MFHFSDLYGSRSLQEILKADKADNCLSETPQTLKATLLFYQIHKTTRKELFKCLNKISAGSITYINEKHC